MEKIRTENKQYFEIYDYITKNVTREKQIEILNFNGQTVFFHSGSVLATDEQVNANEDGKIELKSIKISCFHFVVIRSLII